MRICVDFSRRALTEARAKLGTRGLYILGDITRLPLADEAIDSVISLHTIYHVPLAEQTLAVDELVRVTKPGGRVVIAYVWANSGLMNAVFRARGWLGWLRRFGRPSPFATQPGEAVKTETPALYFHPQNYDWFVRDIAARHSAKLRVWSAISTVFQSRFLSDGIAARIIVGAVKIFENSVPAFAGRFGQYPLFVIDKPGR